MDIERTTHIIAALAEGRDPYNGKALPEDHLCQKPDIIRALLEAREILMREARRERRLQRARLTLPANTGKSWTDEEDRILMNRYKTGSSISDLAVLHARTTGSIRARLEKLGLAPPAAAPGQPALEPRSRRPLDA